MRALQTSLVLLLLAAFLAIAGCAPAQASQQPPPQQNASEPGKDPRGTKVVTIADLFSDKRKDLIGSPVTLRNVQVRSRTGREALWVGSSPEQMILVTMPGLARPLDSRGREAKLDRGTTLDITGVVQRAPVGPLLTEGWGVNRRDVPIVESAGVIVNAMKIVVTAEAE